jgi:hypothetical protein
MHFPLCGDGVDFRSLPAGAVLVDNWISFWALARALGGFLLSVVAPGFGVLSVSPIFRPQWSRWSEATDAALTEPVQRLTENPAFPWAGPRGSVERQVRHGHPTARFQSSTWPRTGHPRPSV